MTVKPRAATQVRLVDLSRGELAHENGSFLFEQLRPGSYRVTAQRLGYAPAEQHVIVVAGAVASVRFALRASAARLAQVGVTGDIGARATNEAIRPTLAVSGAELDRRLAETIAATLQSQSGVTASSLGPATARPVIRGLSGDRVLVLADRMVRVTSVDLRGSRRGGGPAHGPSASPTTTASRRALLGRREHFELR